MTIESILDTYNIKARLCPLVIFLIPTYITILMYFDEWISPSIKWAVLGLLLALSNGIQVFSPREERPRNYALELLRPQNTHFNSVTKNRYYRIMAAQDEAFRTLAKPDRKKIPDNLLESVVDYLRANTRDNHLIKEANILFGFFKSMRLYKTAGIILSLFEIAAAIMYEHPWKIGITPRFTIICIIQILSLVIWITFATNRNLYKAGERYGDVLIRSIDTLPH